MTHSTPQIVYISWAPYCSRSDNTARELGGKSYMVYCEFLGSNYLTILLKYFLQMIWTLYILVKESPDTIFVMSPPVFATVPVFFYCRLFGKKYVVDSHTGAFVNPMWQNVKFLQRFFCKHAAFTIVTHKKMAQIIESWQGKSVIVPDVPIEFPNYTSPALSNDLNITFINSFSADEPLCEVLKAAKRFKNVNFHITGKLNEKSKQFIKQASSNIFFTDFLPNDKFYGLLKSSDVIIALTKLDNTMQRGAYEAIYFGKPVITSDWPILRENFPSGTFFVDNSVEGIVEGITSVTSDIKKFTDQAKTLRNKKIKRWAENKQQILSLIS